MRVHLRKLSAVLPAAALLLAAAAFAEPAPARENAAPAPAAAEAEAPGAETEALGAEAETEFVLPRLTREQLEQYQDILETILVTVNSEEFEHLMEYPQMQALTETVVNKLIVFLQEEPELAKKVLITLGADENTVNLLEAFSDDFGILDQLSEATQEP